MLRAISLFALLAPLVAGLTLQIPERIITQGSVTIRWTATADDVPFSLYLVNEEFNDSFAIANNVDPSLGEITLDVPVVPVRGGYTLKATDVGNINEVYSQTAAFSVGPNPSVTATSSGASSTTRSGTVTTRPSTATGSTLTTPGPSTGSVSFSVGTTTRATGTTGTSAASTATGTAFSAATPLKMNSHVGTLAAVFFSAVAGAAIFML